MEADQRRKLACDSCKRKKLKCEWDQDSICNRCSRTGTECIPQPSNQRKKREKKPNTYLSTLEDRLERMESAMLKAKMGKARRSSEDMGNQAMVDNMSMLKVSDNGVAFFVGSSSGFSIFSPQGLKWISEKTGNNDFSNVLANIPKLGEVSDKVFGPNMWHYLSEDECDPLPSRENATEYIQSFFRGFGSLFPLFDQFEFEERFARQYPVTVSEDVGWYACLNIVFAIGSIVGEKGSLRSTSFTSSPKSINVLDTIWWKWFRNACSTFVELQFREASLASVQALVGISFLLQTLPDPYPCSVVSGAVLRLAQAIGLHRNLGYAGLTTAEVEQRRNTFWIGLMIERGVAFRMGRPSAIHEDDIGIDLPRWGTGEDVHSDHLRHMAKLALLQGRIYYKLYSAKSLTKSTLERLRWVGILDEELQSWRESIPIRYRPGTEINVNTIAHTSSSLTLQARNMTPILMMHFAYFNALTIIHRTSNHQGPWTNKQGENPFNNESREAKLNPRVFAGGAICVNAARSVIGLLNCCADVINSGDLNIVRVVAYYPLTASLTLFANVLQNPWDPQALQDIDLMNNVSAFLAEFFDEQESMETTFITKTFSEVNRLAAEFVRKSQMQGCQPTKRRGDEVNSTQSKRPEISSFNNLPMNAPNFQAVDRPYIQNHPSDAMPTFNEMKESNVAYSNFSPTVAPNQLGMPPQQSSETQQFENDPLKFLDENEMYGDSTYTSAEQTPEWIDSNMDDLLMPESTSWFFPISTPWDFGDQLGEL